MLTAFCGVFKKIPISIYASKIEKMDEEVGLTEILFICWLVVFANDLAWFVGRTLTGK